MSKAQKRTIRVGCTYLGGHRLLHPNHVSVQLSVGRTEVVVEVLAGDCGRACWPSRTVFDVFSCQMSAIGDPRTKSEVTGTDAEYLTIIRKEGAMTRPAVAILILDTREDGGGVSDIRFGFWHESLARDFVLRAVMTLDLTHG